MNNSFQVVQLTIINSVAQQYSSPKCRTELVTRQLRCHNCNNLHDRGINAVMNILVSGHEHLALVIPALWGGMMSTVIDYFRLFLKSFSDSLIATNFSFSVIS